MTLACHAITDKLGWCLLRRGLNTIHRDLLPFCLHSIWLSFPAKPKIPSPGQLSNPPSQSCYWSQSRIKSSFPALIQSKNKTSLLESEGWVNVSICISPICINPNPTNWILCERKFPSNSSRIYPDTFAIRRLNSNKRDSVFSTFHFRTKSGALLRSPACHGMTSFG